MLADVMECGATWVQFQDACADLASHTVAELSPDQAAEARQALETLDVSLRELFADPNFNLLSSPLAWVRTAGWFSFGLCIDAGTKLESGLPCFMTRLLVAAIDGIGGDLECHEALYVVRKLIASGLDLPKALLNAVVALASASGTGCLDVASPETGPRKAAETVEHATGQRLTPDAFDDWDEIGPSMKVSRESSFGVKHASRNGSPTGSRLEEGSRSRGGSGLSVVSYASDTSASDTSATEAARSTSASRADTDVVRNGSTDGALLASRLYGSGSAEQISGSEGTESSQSRHWSAWSDTNGNWSEEKDSRSRNASVKSSGRGDWTDTEAGSEGRAARSSEGSVNHQGGERSPALSRSKQGSFQSDPPETELGSTRKSSEVSRQKGNANPKAAEIVHVWGVQSRPEERPPGPKWEATGLLIALISTGHEGALLVAQSRGLSALLRGLQECPGDGEALRLTIAAAIALLLSDPACRKAASQGPSSVLAPLVSPFLDAAIETKRISGEKGAERELERTLRASGEALLAVARSWSGLFLLGGMRDGRRGTEAGKRNGGTDGTDGTDSNRSLLGDLVVALRVTKSQLVKASILAVFAGLVFQTSPSQTLLLNPAQTPVGTYLSVLLCAINAAGLPSALHDLTLQTDSDPAENGRQKAAANGHTALRLLCHVERLSAALLPSVLRESSETAVDFVGDVISQTEAGLGKSKSTQKRIADETSLLWLETFSSSKESMTSSRPILGHSDSGRHSADGYRNLLQKTRGLRSAHSLPAQYRLPTKPLDDASETASFSGLDSIGVKATISTLDSTRLTPPAGFTVPEWDAEDRETLMRASGVVEKRSKEWLKWDWDVIRTIVSGPLRNGPGKFSHGSKFLKRLTGFFAKRLPGLSPGEEPGRCLDVGRELVAALLETDEGCAYLSGRGSKKSKQECLLLEALASGLRAELAHTGRDSKPLFSRENLRRTLAPQFLALMLTSLTGNERGNLLLEKAGVLASVKALLSGNGSFSFQKLLLQLINFGTDGDQRQLLTAAMTNPHSPSARAFAVTHAARLLRARFEAARPSHAAATAAAPAAPFERWLMQRLLTQLSDGDASVRKRASDALESGCAGLQGFTELLVSLVPRVEGLLVEGDALVLAVLASDAGFEFLKSWTNNDSTGGAAAYARLAERAIFQTLLRQTPNPSSAQTSLRDPDFNPGFEGASSEERLPRHFLGALAASAQGLEVLKSCHVLRTAAAKLLESGGGDRRGAAWSLGHVAARGGAAAVYVIETGGLANLERGVRGAVGNLGLRGTFLQALTLAAASPEVRTWLKARQWVTRADKDRGNCGIEKNSGPLYGSLFDASNGSEVGTSESIPDRWDSDSSVESLGGFLKEPIPNAETETAFYDQLFGVSKSKEIPAVPAEARSTASERKSSDRAEDALGQLGSAVQYEEEGVEGMDLPACICLPKATSILFSLPSDRALDCASRYRVTLREATMEGRSRAAKIFPEDGLEGREGDPSSKATAAMVAPPLEMSSGEQNELSRDGESAVPKIGASAEIGGFSRESSGTAGVNGTEQRTCGTGAGAAHEPTEVREEKKAVALLNGLCNPVTAAESRADLEELLEGYPQLPDGIPFRSAARTLLDEYHFPRSVRLAIHEMGRGRAHWQ
ncbi:rapamycin-insensitive companion of mTOR [Klebsormidium nitens]|uniref:Rapamycin-insensitive companion of mTOR n=1 Tax=Klebsormidium nitens TaxID=105231 RepID=A0A1Y1I726_KLENI|nr:rapamycin-insensitive companion of mTOR [Klebsormidium nitens]|eukprot:GAQ84527.1 rapamycin-insensitive companion of mTOR [Klebsormidium nitens]